MHRPKAGRVKDQHVEMGVETMASSEKTGSIWPKRFRQAGAFIGSG